MVLSEELSSYSSRSASLEFQHSPIQLHFPAFNPIRFGHRAYPAQHRAGPARPQAPVPYSCAPTSPHVRPYGTTTRPTFGEASNQTTPARGIAPIVRALLLMRGD